MGKEGVGREKRGWREIEAEWREGGNNGSSEGGRKGVEEGWRQGLEKGRKWREGVEAKGRSRRRKKGVKGGSGGR